MPDHRPSVARSLALASAALVALAGHPEPAAAQAVAFQADPGHGGRVTDGAPRPPLRRRWVVRLDDRSSYPVAAGGRVFVATGGFLRPTRVIGIDARRGRVLWRRSLPGATRANLAIDGGRLFVSSDAAPRLMALAPQDGRVLWSVTGGWSGAPVPTAAGGSVVLAGQFISVYAQADGRLIWDFAGAGGWDAPLAVAGDSVWAARSCPGALRVRLADRATLWSDHEGCSGGTSSTPAVAGRWLITREPRREVRDAATGAVLGGGWRITYAPAIAGRIGLFANAARGSTKRHYEAMPHGHTLTARSLPSGRVRWRFRGDGYLDSAPIVAGRTVYVGSGSGRVYGLSLRSGRVRWRGDAGAPVLSSEEFRGFLPGLAAADGLLLVPAYRRLAAFG